MLASGMRYLLALTAAVTLFAQDVRVDGSLWATPMYIGGSGEDTPYGAKVDASGNAYVIGWSSSPHLPAGAFLMKVAPSGAILYSVSLFNPWLVAGGATLIDIEVAPDGTVWVLLNRDLYSEVIKVNRAGSRVLMVTFGQPGNVAARVRGAALAVERSGAVWFAGNTGDPGSLTVSGRGPISLARIAPDGVVSQRASVAGAAASDMTVDAAGNIYLVGSVDSEILPTQARSVQRRFNGGECFGGAPPRPPIPCRDAFLLKLDSQGGVLYATYFGGTSHDGAARVAVDGTGAAVLAGVTASADLPIREAIQPQCMRGLPGCADAFVAKIDASGRLVFSTFLGVDERSGVSALAVDDRGSIHVAGVVRGNELPLYRAAQRANGGGPVLASADGGRTWTSGAGVRATTAWQFAWGGGPRPRLYVATDSGVFWSADGGQNWNNEPGLPGYGVRSVSADLTSPGVVYAALPVSGIFKSTDGGRSWAHVLGGRPQWSFEHVAAAPSSPGVVYATAASLGGMTGQPGVYRSADGGGSWVRVTSSVGGVVVHPTDPTVFWASSVGRVYRFMNGGTTFVPTPPLPTFSGTSVRDLALDGRNPDNLYVGQIGGVSRTVDGGRVWQRFTTGLPAAHDSQWYELAVDRADSNVVYVMYRDLYRMLVNRGMWELVTDRVPAASTVQDISANGRHIVVGTTARDDAFVLALSGYGRLLWSTYLGGDLDEIAVAVDVQGRTVHVIGSTRPSWAGAKLPGPPYPGGSDIFWARLRDPIY